MVYDGNNIIIGYDAGGYIIVVGVAGVIYYIVAGGVTSCSCGVVGVGVIVLFYLVLFSVMGDLLDLLELLVLESLVYVFIVFFLCWCYWFLVLVVVGVVGYGCNHWGYLM